jgi:peroxin-10
MGALTEDATAPDIIRSNQKDIFYVNTLHEHVTELLRNAFGSRTIQTYNAELSMLSNLIFYGLTTLAGNRTLGEEYVDILHVDSQRQRLPSPTQRVGYVLSASVVPYLVQKILLPYVRRRLRRANKSSWPRFISKNIEEITSTKWVYALHLAIFYSTASYYHLGKRIFGLRYIFTQKPNQEILDQRGSYSLLGALIIAQLAVQTFLALRIEKPSTEDLERPAAQTKEEPLAENELLFIAKEARTCTLCLTTLKNPTSALCGHLYCWSCIEEWCRIQALCPLCRQPTLPQHLLPLQIY